jgi:hypothetical protein
MDREHYQSMAFVLQLRRIFDQLGECRTSPFLTFNRSQQLLEMQTTLDVIATGIVKDRLQLSEPYP